MTSQTRIPQPGTPAPAASHEPADPHLWLEEVEGEQALTWVGERNAEALASLGGPELEALRAETLEVLDSDDRIPLVGEAGGYLYNFWRDAAHERGLWRRTTLEQYRTPDPQWEVLLDLDALSEAEGIPWVWHGARVRRPDHTRALVSLSRGGSDADTTREFDLETLTWVDGGFERPEAKGGMGWIDADTTFVFTDTGPGSVTTSGYPRQVRRWTRGAALTDAPVVFEAAVEDLAVAGYHDRTPGWERDVVVRSIDFYHEDVHLLGADGTLTHIEVPSSAQVGLKREWLLVELREDWELKGTVHPSGALLAARLDDWIGGDRTVEVLFRPDERTSLADVTWTRSRLVLSVLHDVTDRVQVLTPPADRAGSWQHADVDPAELGAPDLGTLSVAAVDDDESDELWVTSSGYLTPMTLSRVDVGGEAVRAEVLKRAPAFFDTTGLTVEQHTVTSDDGTRVPYFLVRPAGAAGPVPTLLYGYGGFEVSLRPAYSGVLGRAWLARGGAYAVANIRGGGEYGPAWHQAALQEKRLRAYEDFAAVARDLVDRGVTTPAQLGAQGGSNGGLLAGNMLTQYPDLFGAVVIQVPLLDMRRYHRLLAGASWTAEYGDPDDAAQWEFIRTFSPYHLVDDEREYPPVLLTTSTRDDRVHPGHARKMTARLQEVGAAVLSYEHIEGGHGGASTNAQAALMSALAWRFLQRELGL